MIENPLTPIPQFSLPRKSHFWHFCSFVVVISLILNIMIVLVQSLVMSNSLRLCELKHTRLPCPSLSPRVCSDSCSLSQWCRSTLILCCPLLLLPSIFASFRVFSSESALLIRWPKYWSFIFSISPSNEYFLLSVLISLFSEGTLKGLSSTTTWKHQFFRTQPSLWSNSCICTWLLEKP